MNTVNTIAARLSLRPPQAESLQRLARALDIAPKLLSHEERDLAALLAALQNEFPTLQDFERDFPSLCFALATGVGKTRLMGAFIAYLHRAHGIKNFFVLAPNLTIYNKLITDFTRNTPKYVFNGIAEFAQRAPLIITGDNYEHAGAVSSNDDLASNDDDDVRINIFNIAKINSEVRGGKEPKIKRMREVLGDSYFNYLAQLPDLVLLMDESHRYRAQAGMRALNELKPLLGLELTATPFVETSKAPQPFKNVIMDYPLARALADGFVKMPAVVTQRNFNPKNHSSEDIEKIKLEDGVRVHEHTKVELQSYARENNAKLVKPFMLVIARDTTHAAALLALIESDEFSGGQFRGKVIQVDSSKSGKDEEEMITRLLAVESVNEATEIVIHVNMLKEGWDVTNLYTIVPLRAANARTLIEQSIGRGLRLPYGKRTGVENVDRLNIIAHDKFQEIIDEANQGDSVLRLQQVILDAPSSHDDIASVQVVSNIDLSLGLAPTPPSPFCPPEQPTHDTRPNYTAPSSAPIFNTEEDKWIARAVMTVTTELSRNPTDIPTSQSLLQPDTQAKIITQVQNDLQTERNELWTADAQQVAKIVAATTNLIVKQTIDIPRITVVPSGEVSTGFDPFTLDTSRLHLQPIQRDITIHNLHTNQQSHLAQQSKRTEKRPEDYIVHALRDFDDIDYLTQSTLLYDLAGQMLTYLRSYLSEEDTLNVLDTERQRIADEIHTQMFEHFWERTAGYEAKVNQGFTALKPCVYTVKADETVYSVRETITDKTRIRTMLFGHFEKCLYPLQKFDSDTERRFAVILERDAQKWFKPAKGQFQIDYKLGMEQKEYVPDFVIETEDCIAMIETKASKDLNDPEVQAKAQAASTWCKHASDYAQQHGTKTWRYLLIPHDEVIENTDLQAYLQIYAYANKPAE